MKILKTIAVLLLFSTASFLLLEEISKTTNLITDGVFTAYSPQLEEEQLIKEHSLVDFLTTREQEDFKIIPNQITRCVYTIKNIPSPKGAAFSPCGKELWVTSLMNTSYGVFVYSVSSGEKITAINLPGGGGVEVAFDSSGEYAYVTQMEKGIVFQINASSKEIEKTFTTNSSWTKVTAINDAGNKLFASNWSGNNISVFDIATGKLLENIPTVTTPRGIIVIDNILYIAGFASGEIDVVDLVSKERKSLLRTEGAMRHIVATNDKKDLYFSEMGHNEIYKLNRDSNSVTFFAKTEINPNTIALALDDKILIVSNRGTNHPSGNYHIKGEEWGSIMFFDTNSGALLDVVVGGNQPTALTVNEKNGLFAYSNFLDGEVVVCRLPEYEKLTKNTVSVGDYQKYLVK